MVEPISPNPGQRQLSPPLLAGILAVPIVSILSKPLAIRLFRQ